MLIRKNPFCDQMEISIESGRSRHCWHCQRILMPVAILGDMSLCGDCLETLAAEVQSFDVVGEVES